ncbi:hypothetical protein ACS126_05550 [Sphingobacterium lactis]|uniref:hypothetical protein n=1 Tax=Sphingobacterium lactis TaxID=797291 RepID=UPI003EC6E500
MRVFKEKQNMMTWWMLALLLVIMGYQLYLYGTDLERLIREPSLWITVLVIILLAAMQLHTRYDEKGIYVRFFPFVWGRQISWDSIAHAYLRTYDISDFGGWGYRVGRQGKAYNAKGKDGLQLVMKDGSQLMIGTQHPEELKKLIQDYKPYTDEFE